MKRLIIISLCMLAMVKYAIAQEQPTLKQQADKLFDRYEYFKSLTLYLKLAEKKQTAQLTERIADCYRNINHYEDAEAWYEKTVAFADASKASHYNYAEVLLRGQKFKAAKEQYKLYFDNDPEVLTQKLASCDSAANWLKQKSGYKVKNEAGMNTEYSDWGLNYAGKSSVVFTSDRKTDEQHIDNRTGNNWFRMYEMGGGAANELVFANNVKDIFSSNYHIGPMALSPTADTAYITVTTALSAKNLPVDRPGSTTGQRLYSRRLQLLIAAKKDGKWNVFGSFLYNDIKKYSVGNAALSNNGKVLYFASDMPGGEGKTDIWYCEKQADGKWGSPVNCGKNINTKEDEDFPVVGWNNALYYSSKGLPGMGGYDIFKTTGEKAQWSTPKNLKYPINTTSDDLYLVTRDGLNGYFSSNREGGKGSDDIYSFTYAPPDTFKVKTPTDTLAIRPPKTKPVFDLITIYYDLDKSDIRPDAAVELDKLIVILKQHPALNIELSGYTDSRASIEYNLALSQRRAQAAVAYLAKNGIPESRLVARYYGKTNLVTNCPDGVNCTEAEHQLNRRTEFKVIGGQ